MSALTESPAWMALARHRESMAGVHMRSLFAGESGRFQRFSCEACGLLLDYAKNRVTNETMSLLMALARQQDVSGWREQMFSGGKINITENRAVLHTALRAPVDRPVYVDGHNIAPDIARELKRMLHFADAVRYGSWTGYTSRQIRDIVSIGIGGSDLGAVMVTEALRPYHHPDLRLRFVSNVDGTHLAETLGWLDPETTLFIIASKTFTTQETMTNAHSARAWFLDEGAPEDAISRHFIALSTNEKEVRAFGIALENMFTFWDWVGGRYSLWSSIGLPIALAIGSDRFQQLLAGAHAMDEHFRSAPFEQNMPIIMAMLGVWYVNFWGAGVHAIIPYDQYLHRFPSYMQQADMESNGKSVDRDGHFVDYDTGPVIFGEPGTNGQHAFFQLMHQGTRVIPADFLASAISHNPLVGPLGAHHEILLANFYAQTEALMLGKSAAEVRAELQNSGMSAERIAQLTPHKVFSGDRPSNTVLYKKLDPFTLGALIALYEHKIFVQGVVWNVNSYDQWGVELGKQLAREILPELGVTARVIGREPHGHDSSTVGLIQWFRKNCVEE
ncbi:glucose-6-phosphate isomerase [Azospirillaceae bacterium]